MILKTGTDIIEVERIKESIEKYKEKFLKRVYTDKEIEYCEGRQIQKYQSYAGRFAAKEAIFKAISAFINNKFELEWKDIEVLNDKDGRPVVNLSNTLKESIINNCNNSKEYQIDISISHIKEFAMANAIICIM